MKRRNGLEDDALFILQPFRRFTYIRGRSPSLPSLRLRHQLILQPFRCFTYVKTHSPTLLTLFLRHRLFTYVTWRAATTSQLILQPFRCFTYVTAHFPTLPLLHLRHSVFSNPSFASPTSQDFHLRHLASRPCFLLLKADIPTLILPRHVFKMLSMQHVNKQGVGYSLFQTFIVEIPIQALVKWWIPDTNRKWLVCGPMFTGAFVRVSVCTSHL